MALVRKSSFSKAQELRESAGVDYTSLITITITNTVPMKLFDYDYSSH